MAEIYRNVITVSGNRPTSSAVHYARGFSATDSWVSAPTVLSEGQASAFLLDKGKYEVEGKELKLKLQASVSGGSSAPNKDITFGLYPVTKITAGAFTIGAAVTGSTASLEGETVPANTTVVIETGDFAFPSFGLYLIGCAWSGTASAAANAVATLFARNV